MVVWGFKSVSKASTIEIKTSRLFCKLVEEIIFKLSALVWYSLYSPNLLLLKPQTGRSIPGAQYCLSSEPLYRKEYFFIEN